MPKSECACMRERGLWRARRPRRSLRKRNSSLRPCSMPCSPDSFLCALIFRLVSGNRLDGVEAIRDGDSEFPDGNEEELISVLHKARTSH